MLSEIAFLKNATPDEILDNFNLAKYVNRQYGIVAGDPHTYLKPELVHLMNQLHEVAQENFSLCNAIKKERDDRVAKETKDRKEYLDLRTKLDKDIDEKLKKIQELVSVSDEQTKQFKHEAKLSDERFKPLAEKAAKLAAILDSVDTERVRLFQMGYGTLDVKRRKYIYIMLDAIGQSEEDSEKVLLKVRQGKLSETGCPHDYESPGIQ